MESILAAVDGTAARESPSRDGTVNFRILGHRNASIQTFGQVHVYDGRFNQHLREQHVQLGDDVRDGVHVLPRGEDEERIAPLVGDDFCLAENLDRLILAVGPRRLVDDAQQPLLKSSARRRRAVGGGPKRARLDAALDSVATGLVTCAAARRYRTTSRP